MCVITEGMNGSMRHTDSARTLAQSASEVLSIRRHLHRQRSCTVQQVRRCDRLLCFEPLDIYLVGGDEWDECLIVGVVK